MARVSRKVNPPTEFVPNRAARRQTLRKAPTKAPAAPKKETSSAKRIAKLEADLALVAWEHEKFVHQIRMLLAQQMLANPQVQQRLAQEMVQRMSQQQVPGHI